MDCKESSSRYPKNISKEHFHLRSNFIRLREMTSTESGRVIPQGRYAYVCSFSRACCISHSSRCFFVRRIQCPFCGIVVASTEGVTVQAQFGMPHRLALYAVNTPFKQYLALGCFRC
jgi:hypothetical protein